MYAFLMSLAACFDRSISGSYVVKDSSSAELLPLTQAQDGKIAQLHHSPAHVQG